MADGSPELGLQFNFWQHSLVREASLATISKRLHLEGHSSSNAVSSEIKSRNLILLGMNLVAPLDFNYTLKVFN